MILVTPKILKLGKFLVSVILIYMYIRTCVKKKPTVEKVTLRAQIY